MLGRNALFGAIGLVCLAGCGAPPPDDEERGSTESAQARRSLPSFDAMWAAYPHGDSETVKAMIGGRVDAAWITNTCTVRVSHALNEAGFLIPKGPANDVAGLHTVSGGNGNQYAYRVLELKAWLRANVGRPTITVESSSGVGVDSIPFVGLRGIIMFEVDFSDADGHFDLWNEDRVAHEEYFADATSVSLWEVDGSPERP